MTLFPLFPHLFSMIDGTRFTWVYILKRRRQWHPTPVLLPGKSHGQSSLVGSSPWGPEESDTTEQLHFHFSLPFTGEGNGNPLQCSCLENPRDGGAWWAAVSGVAQSWTRLKQLSSSSSIFKKWYKLLYQKTNKQGSWDITIKHLIFDLSPCYFCIFLDFLRYN